MSDSEVTVYCKNPACKEPFSKTFSPSDFAEWIEEEFEERCPSCRKEMSVDGASLECHICETEQEFYSLSMIPLLINDERCCHCAGPHEVDFYSIRVAGSWSYHLAAYDWFRRGKGIGKLERVGRSDYWEGLVHFCSAENFVSILKENCIRAASTGLYHKWKPNETKAVCLTEATKPNWEELQKLHGEYGFIFRKSAMIELGGAPAIYLPQGVIDSMKAKGEKFPPTLWPYLNKLNLSPIPRQRYDYLHEREWRVPGDIDFAKVKPFAITFPKRRPRIDGEELIFAAGMEFGELSEYADGDDEDDED